MIFQEEEVNCAYVSFNSSTAAAVIAFASFTGVCCVTIGVLTFKYRRLKVMVYGQVDRFLFFLSHPVFVKFLMLFFFNRVANSEIIFKNIENTKVAPVK